MKREMDIFDRIISGKKVTTTVKTRRGNFVIAFPLPSDLRQIEILISKRIEGQPVDSITKDGLLNVQIYATLDIVITDSPDWWQKLDSSEQCPDDALITKLYRRYLRLYRATQKRLGEGNSGEALEKDVSEESSESVDDGAFSGITN